MPRNKQELVLFSRVFFPSLVALLSCSMKNLKHLLITLSFLNPDVCFSKCEILLISGSKHSAKWLMRPHIKYQSGFTSVFFYNSMNFPAGHIEFSLLKLNNPLEKNRRGFGKQTTSKFTWNCSKKLCKQLIKVEIKTWLPETPTFRQENSGSNLHTRN